VGRYLATRLIGAIPTLLGVSVLTFLFIRLIPGDAIAARLGTSTALTPEQLAGLRAYFGLDQPLYQQYWTWLTSLLHGDFGYSIRTGRPVLVEILNYRKDGTAFRNGVMITPLFDPDGGLAWFLGSQVDLGEPSSDRLSGRQARAAALVADLPRRQHEVLELMARGLLNKQIAWELKISEKTVKMHRALLLERLGVATTAEAIRLAVEAGL